MKLRAAAAAAVMIAVAGCANPPTPGASSAAAPPSRPTDSDGLVLAPNPSQIASQPTPSGIRMPGTPMAGETPTAAWVTAANGAGCPPINLTRIRASAHRMAASALPAAAQGNVISTDARSFAATVTAHDLTLAQIDVSNYAPDHRLILIVNHGNWTESTLPVPMSNGGNAGTGTADPLAGVTWHWIVYPFDPTTGRAWSYIVASDDACFNGG